MSRFADIVNQANLQRGDAPPLEIIPGDDTALTDSEAQALDYYERVIDRGLKTFVEVGAALAHVRDLRLYRVDYPTFEAYCDDRWGLARKRAYQLIDAAGVAQEMSKILDKTDPPTIESHAAALARLKDRDQQAQAWEQAIQRAQDTGKRLTAALVEAVVQEMQPRPAAAVGEPEQALVDAQALDDQGARVIEPPEVGQVRVRVTANEQEDFQAVAALLATCGVQLQGPQAGRLPKYPASWRAYGTLDLGELQQPVDSATPLEVAALYHTIRDLQQHVANLHTANDAELSQMNATIATLQARIAGLEGENERLREEAAAARGELERTYQHLARQDTPGAHQRVAQALTTLEAYQEHITRAQGYKPTSDRGEAVSPLLRLVEQVYITLKGGTSEP